MEYNSDEFNCFNYIQRNFNEWIMIMLFQPIKSSGLDYAPNFSRLGQCEQQLNSTEIRRITRQRIYDALQAKLMAIKFV